MKHAILGLSSALILAGCANRLAISETPSCTLSSQDTAVLEQWRQDGFSEQQTDDAANAFASCLGHPDPFLRDRIGYEGLTVALRSGNITEATRRDLISQLSQNLGVEDADGFVAPFSALALSELVRTDRVDPFLTAEERTDISSRAASYLNGVSDYRAFSDSEGWRHGVAHGADIAMQLALNPNVTTASLEHLRQAISQQITNRSGYAFHHSEPERLARPIYFMATRGAFESETWTAWFETLSDPAPLSDWNEAYQSEAELARLHNLKAFARVLYVNASLSEDEAMQPIADGALNMLRSLP